MVRDDRSGVVSGPPPSPDRAGDEVDVLGGDTRRAGTEQWIEPADCGEDLAPEREVCAVNGPRVYERGRLDARGGVIIAIDTLASVG